MALVRSIILMIALLLGSAAHAGDPSRIVAIGDLHGDHEAFRDIAMVAQLIDAEGRWIGGDATLVQLGDVTDRGPDSLKIIRDLQRLEDEAEDAGGEVIVMIGNHEAMNIIGDLRYVHPDEYRAFRDRRSGNKRKAFYRNNKNRILAAMQERLPEATEKQLRAAWEADHPLGWIEHRLAWQVGGELADYYADRPAIVRIGDSIFVHGGVSLAVAQQGIDTANEQIAAATKDPALAASLEDPGNPLWYRGFLPRFAGERTAEQVAQEFDATMSLLDARRMIVAHTPRLEGIDALHDGRLVRIDTGIADYYGGRLSFLEMFEDGAFAVEQVEDGSWQRRRLPDPGAMQ